MQQSHAFGNDALLCFEVRINRRLVFIVFSQIIRWRRHDECDRFIGKLTHEDEVVFTRKNGVVLILSPWRVAL